MCVQFLINKKKYVASVYAIINSNIATVHGYGDSDQDTADGKIV